MSIFSTVINIGSKHKINGIEGKQINPCRRPSRHCKENSGTIMGNKLPNL
jgi:hypothetical protein